MPAALLERLSPRRTRRATFAPVGGDHGSVRDADHELVLRVHAGDEHALAEIYDRFGSLVFGIARRVTGDDTRAEDVVQEVFVYLWTRPDRFDVERGSLKSYLGVMAHRRAVDTVRSDGRRSRRDAAFGSDVIVETTESIDLTEATVIRSDEARRVRRAVALLPPEQWAAVRLAYFGGHTYREVADLLGIPEGTAKSRLRLALSKLNDLLVLEGVTA